MDPTLPRGQLRGRLENVGQIQQIGSYLAGCCGVRERVANVGRLSRLQDRDEDRDRGVTAGTSWDLESVSCCFLRTEILRVIKGQWNQWERTGSLQAMVQVPEDQGEGATLSRGHRITSQRMESLQSENSDFVHRKCDLSDSQKKVFQKLPWGRPKI